MKSKDEMSNQPQISLGSFEFTSVGVKRRRGRRPPLEDWTGPLQFALWCQKAGPWWIGDMINSGEDIFGESFAQICEESMSPEMISRYASVARRVPIQNRTEALSWSAHTAVARLSLMIQRKMLKKAVKNNWNSTELRAEVRAFLASQKNE